MKITVEHLESLIANEQFHVIEGTTVTVCCLTLKSGFAVIGKSACISRDDFDAQIGREVARSNAFEKLWELEAYRVKSLTN